MRKRTIILTILIVTVVVIGIGIYNFSACRSNAKQNPKFPMPPNWDFYQGINKIKKGMTKQQVQKISGDPINCDHKYIWLYCDCPKEKNMTWSDLISSSGNYFFIIFDKDAIAITDALSFPEYTPWGIYDKAGGAPELKDEVFDGVPY